MRIEEVDLIGLKGVIEQVIIGLRPTGGWDVTLVMVDGSVNLMVNSRRNPRVFKTFEGARAVLVKAGFLSALVQW